MVGELTQWAPGISLGWALASMALGVLIVVVIVVRLVGDRRRDEDDEE